MSYIGIIAGGVAGYLYWKFIGCASGTCPITSNKYISVIYGALLGSLLISATAGSASKHSFMHKIKNGDSSEMYKNISADEIISMLDDSEVVIIDVRTPSEWSGGYIAGTDKFIDFNSEEFGEKILELDRSKTYVVYCRSGNRSTKACRIMSEKGFNNLYNLSGGISIWGGEIIKNEK